MCLSPLRPDKGKHTSFLFFRFCCIPVSLSYSFFNLLDLIRVGDCVDLEIQSLRVFD